MKIEKKKQNHFHYSITVCGGYGPGAWTKDITILATSIQDALNQIEQTVSDCDAEVISIEREGN